MRVATDIGGTFTDLVFLDERTGRLGAAKSDSTPPSFEEGVMAVLAKSALAPEEITFFAHGTTVVINALTERTGAKTGLITTEGFRDTLEIGRGNRPDLYNFRYVKPRPFVPRYLRTEVRERMDYKGNELVPLDEDRVRAAVAYLLEQGVEAVAIAFLHAYANPAHEERAAAIVCELTPNLKVTVSSAITREWREYERTSTAVLNSYVLPVASRYLERLDRSLAEARVPGRRYAMQSNGGIATFAALQQAPIHLVESGPAAGMFGAATLGRLIGEDNVIALDIGGTTAKCSLIDRGELRITTDYKIEWNRVAAGYPIRVPVVDIVEIGSGGGSIAWLDEAHALHVGPRSAGAMPGPVAYGRGGTEPTVTDANLLAGRIDPEYFLGGDIHLDVDRARRALGRLGEGLGLDAEAMALGIVRLANANMENALKLVSVQRGYDPRDFVLVAFGGAGSMHAADLAAQLGVRRVVIPRHPAVFSAWGMLMTDLKRSLVRTRILQTDTASPAAIDEVWFDMQAQVLAAFASEGYDPGAVIFQRSVDMRYYGQEHTVEVPFGTGPATAASLGEAETAFHGRHEQAYTFRLPDSRIEIVNFRLTAVGPVEKPSLKPWTGASVGAVPSRHGERPVLFEEGWLVSAIYERDHLGAGARITGPAVVQEPDASTLVPPGYALGVDRYGNLLIEARGGSGE